MVMEQLIEIGPAPAIARNRLIRVFPRRTKATPDDPLAYYGPPDLFAQADEIHIDVTFTYDKARAESLAEDWKHVAPVKLGGVAYGDPGRAATSSTATVRRSAEAK